MNLFKSKRTVNIVMTGQMRSAVSTVAGAMAGVRPKNPLPSNGVENWHFAKGLVVAHSDRFSIFDFQKTNLLKALLQKKI